MSNTDMIDLKEAEYFYRSPHTLIDNSGLESFGLIKSTVELFVYYGVNDFSANDIKELFEKLQLIQKKNGRVFLPSSKKISGVLECYLKKGKEQLSLDGNIFHIISWDCTGYRCEIESAKQKGYL